MQSCLRSFEVERVVTRMQILAKFPTGETITLEVEVNDIDFGKAKIRGKDDGVASTAFYWKGGNVLEDGHTLAGYNIQKAVAQAVPPPPPPPPPPPDGSWSDSEEEDFQPPRRTAPQAVPPAIPSPTLAMPTFEEQQRLIREFGRDANVMDPNHFQGCKDVYEYMLKVLFENMWKWRSNKPGSMTATYMWREWATRTDLTLVRGFIFCSGSREAEQTQGVVGNEYGRWWPCVALIPHDGEKKVTSYCPGLALQCGRPWCGHLDRIIVLVVDLYDVPVASWPRMTSSLYAPPHKKEDTNQKKQIKRRWGPGSSSASSAASTFASAPESSASSAASSAASTTASSSTGSSWAEYSGGTNCTWPSGNS